MVIGITLGRTGTYGIKMVDEETKAALNSIGKKLSEILPEFYGKVAFNFYNGNYVSFNVELTVKKDNLYEGAKK